LDVYINFLFGIYTRIDGTELCSTIGGTELCSTIGGKPHNMRQTRAQISLKLHTCLLLFLELAMLTSKFSGKYGLQLVLMGYGASLTTNSIGVKHESCVQLVIGARKQLYSRHMKQSKNHSS
jgi:hypothetical protein